MLNGQRALGKVPKARHDLSFNIHLVYGHSLQSMGRNGAQDGNEQEACSQWGNLKVSQGCAGILGEMLLVFGKLVRPL